MTDFALRLRERAAQEGLAVPDELIARLLAYFDLLQRWNRKINLTSLSDTDAGIDRLLLEPLSAAQHLPVGVTLADLGSGGGSPAIPLALALGTSNLLMIESRSRKASFLREAAREVGLSAIVEAGRFEDVSRMAAYVRQFDVVSVRAVRPDRAMLSACSELLCPKGSVALFGAPESAFADSSGGNLAWRGSWPLLRSTGTQLTVLFHVEQA